MKKIVFLAREGERGPAAAQAVVEGLIVADFESDKYRTEKKNGEIQSVALADLMRVSAAISPQPSIMAA